MKIWVLETGYMRQSGGCHSLYFDKDLAIKLINDVIIEGNELNIKKFNELSDDDKEFFKEPAKFIQVEHKQDNSISWADGINYLNLREMLVTE